MFKGCPIYQPNPNARQYGSIIQKKIQLNTKQTNDSQSSHLELLGSKHRFSKGFLDSQKHSVANEGQKGMLIQEQSVESSPKQKRSFMSCRHSLSSRNRIPPMKSPMMVPEQITSNPSQTENKTPQTSGPHTPGACDLNKLQQQIKQITSMASPLGSVHYSPKLTPIQQLAEGESSQEGSPKKQVKNKSQLLNFSVKKNQNQNKHIVLGMIGTSLSNQFNSQAKQVHRMQSPINAVLNTKSINSSNNAIQKQFATINDISRTVAVNGKAQIASFHEDLHSHQEMSQLKKFHLPTSRVTLLAKQSLNRSDVESPKAQELSEEQKNTAKRNQQMATISGSGIGLEHAQTNDQEDGNIGHNNSYEGQQVSEESPLVIENRMTHRLQQTDDLLQYSSRPQLIVFERIDKKKPLIESSNMIMKKKTHIELKVNYQKQKKINVSNTIPHESTLQKQQIIQRSNNDTSVVKDQRSSQQKFMGHLISWNPDGTYEFYTQSYFDEQVKVREEKERAAAQTREIVAGSMTARRCIQSFSKQTLCDPRERDQDEKTHRVFSVPLGVIEPETQNLRTFDGMNDIVLDQKKERLFGRMLQNSTRRGMLNQTDQQSFQLREVSNRTLSNRASIVSQVGAIGVHVSDRRSMEASKQLQHLGINSDKSSVKSKSTLSDNKTTGNFEDALNLEALLWPCLQASNPYLKKNKDVITDWKVLKSTRHSCVSKFNKQSKTQIIRKSSKDSSYETITSASQVNLTDQIKHPNYLAFFTSKERGGRFPQGGAGSVTKNSTNFSGKFDLKKRFKFKTRRINPKLLMDSKQHLDLNDQQFFDKIEQKMYENEQYKSFNLENDDDVNLVTPKLTSKQESQNKFKTENEAKTLENNSELIDSNMNTPKQLKSKQLLYQNSKKLSSNTRIDWLDSQPMVDTDVRSTLKAPSPLNEQEQSMHPQIIQVQSMQSKISPKVQIMTKEREIVTQKEHKNAKSAKNNSQQTFHKFYQKSNKSPIKVDIQVSDFLGKCSSKRSEGSISRINQDPYPIRVLQPKLQNEYTRYTYIKPADSRNEQNKQGMQSPDKNMTIFSNRKSIKQQAKTPQIRVVFSKEHFGKQDQNKSKMKEGDLSSRVSQNEQSIKIQDELLKQSQTELENEIQIKSGQNILRDGNQSKQLSITDDNPQILTIQDENKNTSNITIGQKEIEEQIDKLIENQNRKAFIRRQTLNQPKKKSKKKILEQIGMKSVRCISHAQKERLQSNLLIQKYFDQLPVSQQWSPRDQQPTSLLGFDGGKFQNFKKKQQYPPVTRGNNIQNYFLKISTKTKNTQNQGNKQIRNTLDEEERMIEFQKSKGMLSKDYQDFAITDRLSQNPEPKERELQIQILKDNAIPYDYFEGDPRDSKQSKATSLSRSKYRQIDQNNVHTFLTQFEPGQNSTLTNQSLNKSSNPTLSMFKPKDQESLKQPLLNIDSIIKENPIRMVQKKNTTIQKKVTQLGLQSPTNDSVLRSSQMNSVNMSGRRLDEEGQRAKNQLANISWSRNYDQFGGDKDKQSITKDGYDQVNLSGIFKEMKAWQ